MLNLAFSSPVTFFNYSLVHTFCSNISD